MSPKNRKYQKRNVKTPDTPKKVKKTRSCLRAALIHGRTLFGERIVIPDLKPKSTQKTLKDSCLAYLVNQRRKVTNSDIPQQMAKTIRKCNRYFQFKTALKREEEIHSKLFEKLQSLDKTIETYKDSIEREWAVEVKKVHECELIFFEKMAEDTAHKLIESKKLKHEFKDVVIKGAYMIAKEYEFMSV